MSFLQLAEEKHEEGKRALQEAKRVEAEHEARLTSIHTQTERLRQQEKQILQVCVICSHGASVTKYNSTLTVSGCT